MHSKTGESKKPPLKPGSKRVARPTCLRQRGDGRSYGMKNCHSLASERATTATNTNAHPAVEGERLARCRTASRLPRQRRLLRATSPDLTSSECPSRES
jgi:hypothetical protein